MFDRFFCKKFQAKEITFAMIWNYIDSTVNKSNIFNEIRCILAIGLTAHVMCIAAEVGLFSTFVLLISVALVAFSFVAVFICLPVVIFGEKVVAVCPLSKQ